jgi:hypothetical protein
MASTSKKTSAGMASKPRKGTAAYYQWEYEQAKKGGAAKTAKKLVPKNVKYAYPDTPANALALLHKSKPTKLVSQNEAKVKMVTQNILNDKSKTATRAKIVEAARKKKKK